MRVTPLGSPALSTWCCNPEQSLRSVLILGGKQYFQLWLQNLPRQEEERKKGGEVREGKKGKQLIQNYKYFSKRHTQVTKNKIPKKNILYVQGSYMSTAHLRQECVIIVVLTSVPITTRTFKPAGCRCVCLCVGAQVPFSCRYSMLRVVLGLQLTYMVRGICKTIQMLRKGDHWKRQAPRGPGVDGVVLGAW